MVNILAIILMMMVIILVLVLVVVIMSNSETSFSGSSIRGFSYQRGWSPRDAQLW